MQNVPKVSFAIIGGSGTWAGDFPESAGFEGVTVLERGLEFETPFGTTVPMKLAEISSALTQDRSPRRFLTVPFHGYRSLAPHDNPSEQIFWVFQQAGVKVITAEGSGGGINRLLDPGDIVIPHDFFDMTKRPSNIHRFNKNIVRMASPTCSYLRSLLYEKAGREYRRVFSRGLYANTEPPRFETASEIRFLAGVGCDICGHTMVPEVYLARAIGACYAAAYLVSNYAEGVEDPSWKGSSIFEHYADSAAKIGRVTLGVVAAWDAEKCGCHCGENIIEVPDQIKNRISS
ncbi:MAG: MTAP family purine nucleoside phosphorylase [Treponema sp.]|nr:MTAP family purine nucleoside phosphorylase [Treponema sp.]